MLVLYQSDMPLTFLVKHVYVGLVAERFLRYSLSEVKNTVASGVVYYMLPS